MTGNKQQFASGDDMRTQKRESALTNGREPAEGREQLLDGLEDRARCYGATHFLATGLPMPNRPLDSLVLRMNWAVHNPPTSPTLMFSAYDPVFQQCLTTWKPFIWQTEIRPEVGDGDDVSSSLLKTVAANGRVSLVAVPINEFHPFQGCVVFAGPNVTLSDRDLMSYEFQCQSVFAKLIKIGAVSDDRPGDLSDRERLVVELTATGRTASEIARRLNISQRTVHAHLQNASDKLNASNKTHTVVEAIRYGQISV